VRRREFCKDFSVLDRISNSHTNELADGKLFALQNTMKLDGRVSSYPASATGYSVTNCYLLRQPDAAWLIDTGFGGDEQALRGQIESRIPRTLPLSLLPLRLNEFMSIQNIDPFVQYFNVKECFTGNADAAFWFDFGAGSDSGEDTLQRLKITTISREETIPIGDLGRPVVVYQAPIRLIATRWIYDEATKTMFTSDMFTHTWRDRPDGPWIIQDGDDDPTDFDHVRSFLLNTRYWWLEGVDTAKLRKGMDEILSKHDIETIAPGYGCILRGKKTVEKHIKLVDDVLRSLDKSVATSRYVGRDEER
jgi:glyoxylase-like metal-dependent hydrolase (beta-lactamase superfamily II)